MAGFAALAGLSIVTGAPALATAVPATGDTVPTTSPSGSPSAGVSVTETGIYLYRKVDAEKPAAWTNSGKQTFLAKQPGHQWFTDVSSLVPSVPFEVCGPGWAVQQDVLEFEDAYEWPTHLLYPEPFPGNPKLKDSKHQELEEVMTVPDCASTPTPTDTPSATPTPTPTPTPTDTPSQKPTPTPTDTPSQKPTPTPTPTDTPSATPSTTPAGSVTPPGSNGTPPAPATTDPGVQVAGNPSPRVPDAGLAHTGAGGMWLAAAGAAILAVGAVLVVIARRRKA
ncbi:LPXTG cell wall anchor domain-containing protein [Arthrobacter sp. zg-Y238]|uniref:LPXTG cell wall anchor domain-containing protein n=1 Tax=Arthrobacter sp. zg-Y238 TaxID=2964614 RepID=UPI002107FC50|nr:LPXTG cell wall anchor domain-containing protein [Arthrobacter sp. zg-Y238]